jgi:signal transduction histidine kinase
VRDIDAKMPLLVCDKRRIRQVLLNLVSNAVKFTEQGTITLSAKMYDDKIHIAVMDTGPGISADQQDMIFEPFVQTEAGIKHAGGTGLGLPISKSLTTAHGGRLWVESAPGQGAAFHVELPLTLEASPVEEVSKR